MIVEGDYEFADDRFRFCVSAAARVERLYTGSVWAEGPAYFPSAPLTHLERHTE